jgi:hypothetical protein
MRNKPFSAGQKCCFIGHLQAKSGLLAANRFLHSGPERKNKQIRQKSYYH